MKLGKDTASLTNYLMSGTNGQPVPEIGMGATQLAWTDRYACTIVEVFTIKNVQYIAIQKDNNKLISGSCMSEEQEYEFTPNLKAKKEYYRFKNNKWESIVKNEDTGRWNKFEGFALRIGERDKYRDPCF